MATTKSAAKGKSKAKAGAKKNLPAKKGSTAVASPGAWGGLSGAGTQAQTQDDMSLPFLAILHDNPGMEDVKGAENGMWFNTVTREVYGSSVVVVPCYTEKAYVEWKPDRGGFAGVHTPSSAVVADAKADAAEHGRAFNELMVGENVLEETFYVYVLILDDADATVPKEFAVCAFKSTHIKHYRKANTAWRTRPGNPPLFANRVRLSTKKHSDGKYKWYLPVFTPAVGDTWEDAGLPVPENPGNPETWHPVIKAGFDLMQQVENGLARAAFETQADVKEAPAGAGGPDTPF